MAKLASYTPAEIEPKWTNKWSELGVYKTKESDSLNKEYVLGMFPYPSGEGLHTGHGRIFTAVDVIARYWRLKGKEVMMPIGWDAFGLPAENAAIKLKTNPMQMVPKNEANFKRQMEDLGLSYDWDRVFSTSDPAYYKWTQWLFLKLYGIKNAKGERLVYKKEVAINWCPKCKTGLANEEVLANGTHERCGTLVTTKMLPQWVMRITDYSDRLLNDLDQFEWERDGQKVTGLDWPKGILEMQRNWIGRKEGVLVKFAIEDTSVKEVEVFTTRLETIFGVSFVAVAPELIKKWIELGYVATETVRQYVDEALAKAEQQRLEDNKVKTGVVTGLMAVNPMSGEKVPVYVADYVLGDVSTGAIMGVPAHDERDGEFAEKFSLPLKEVVRNDILVNSDGFDGLNSERAKDAILKALDGKAKKEISYHLRDWVFSRQRYWGEPFPLVYCPKCGDENGVVPLKEDQLPLRLPELASYEPSETGESPLAKVTEWVETVCPICGGPAKRETDTMPNWAGSCWYFLRFADPKNDKEPWSDSALAHWLPVDWYLGGAEHAVLHLLYARFWTKAFFDLGLVKFQEPFLRLRSVGMVLASDGRKMSKSLGNVINPDDVVKEFGADAVRLYEMFMGPWDQTIAWETRSLVGCRRFLDKVWSVLSEKGGADQTEAALSNELTNLIKKVESDITGLKFNTAVAAMMKFVNQWQASEKGLSNEDIRRFLLILSPFAPYMTEEVWETFGGSGSIHQSSWPEAGTSVEASKVTMVIQVNGKVRGTMEVDREMAEKTEEIEAKAKAEPGVAKWLDGVTYEVVFIPKRLINFVLK